MIFTPICTGIEVINTKQNNLIENCQKKKGDNFIEKCKQNCKNNRNSLMMLMLSLLNILKIRGKIKVRWNLFI